MTKTQWRKTINYSALHSTFYSDRWTVGSWWDVKRNFQIDRNALWNCCDCKQNWKSSNSSTQNYKPKQFSNGNIYITAQGRCWMCVCACLLAALLLLLHPQRAEERVPQRLLQGDPSAHVVLQHAAEQVEQLPLFLSLPLHVLLKDRHSLWLPAPTSSALRLQLIGRCECSLPWEVCSASWCNHQRSCARPSSDARCARNAAFCTQYNSS